MTREKSEQTSPKSFPVKNFSLSHNRMRSKSDGTFQIRLPEKETGSPKSSPRFSPRIFSPRSKKKHSLDSSLTSPRIIYRDKKLPFSAEAFYKLSQSILKNDTKTNHNSGNIGNFEDEKGIIYNICITKSNGGTHFLLLNKNQKIGKGGTANVFIAYDLLSGDKVAAKIFDASVPQKMIGNEVDNLEIMGWYRGQCSIGEQNIVFMKFAPGINLLKCLYMINSKYSDESSDYFLSKKTLPYLLKIQLTKRFLESLQEIHDHGLIHRDIKTENIRVELDHNQQVRSVQIIDIGNAIDKTKDSKLYSSSFFYAPPEICLFHLKDTKEPYSQLSDIFSAGVVIAEIFSCKNVQTRYRKKLAEMIEVDEKRDLTPSEISLVLKDMFRTTKAQETQVLKDALSVDAYLYHNIAEKKIKEIIRSMTSKLPRKRLKGAGLSKIISDINELELKFIQQQEFIMQLMSLKTKSKAIGLDINQLLDNMKHPDSFRSPTSAIGSVSFD